MKLKQLKTLLGLIGVCGIAASSTQAQTITPAMAAPAGSVNTTIPGFRFRTFQAGPRLNPTAALPAEQMISGLAIDPLSNAPFNNLATPNDLIGGFWWDVDGFINTHEQQVVNPDIAGGNFTPVAAAPHNVYETPLLGIPGLDVNPGDYFVQEYTGFLQLPAGTVRFGVNSDDGFKLTIGSGLNPYALPGTVIPIPGVQLAILDGTRGFGNTEANITVTTAGIYPFRLIWWESGGANSGAEFFTFAPGTTSGNRYLVNDTNQPLSIKAYRQALVVPSYFTGRYPIPASTGVEALPFLKAIIEDGAVAIDPDSVVAMTDGVVLPVKTVTKTDKQTLIVAQAAMAYAPNTAHTNMIIVADTAGTKTTNAWSFTVSNYPTIPATYSVGAVDTTKPGFNVKVNQMQYNKAPQTSVAYAAERQIASGFINPETGLPYPNTANLIGPIPDPADPTLPIVGTETAPVADASGFFVDADVVNYSENIPASQGNFPDDEPTPGITANFDLTDGSALVADRYVVSVETIIELKAGVYRFGVNSDDGFRLTAGRGPGDVTGIQISVANVDRGPTDSYGDVNIVADGFYPFRMMYWETGGGSEAEFFVFRYDTGEKTLINAATGGLVLKSFRESPNTPPYVSRTLPTVNEAYVFADENVVIDVADGGTALDDASVIVRINNVDQAVTKAKTGKTTTITRVGSVTNLLPSGTDTVTLIYSTTPAGGSAVFLTNTWSFVVPPYTRVIPPANRVAASDVSGSGFKWVKNVQIDRSKDANQGNGGRYVANGAGGNNMPGPEIELSMGYLQLDGTPHANMIDSAAWDGTDVEFLNFNWTTAGTANSGLFNGDVAGPALPGTGTSNVGLDNSVHEIFTYIDLKKGSHIFGVNVDDGWTLHSSPNTRDTLGTLVGFRNAPGGNAGQPLHNPNAALNVIVPEDGIYPFRFLFWEGGGGVNIEIVALDRNTRILSLINDKDGLMPPTQPAVGTGPSILPSTKYVAYSTFTGATKPWTKFSVYPQRNDATLWQNIIQQSGPGPITVRVANGNPADIANDSINTRPFGDSIGAIVADLGTGTVGMVLDGNSVTPVVSDIPNSTDKLVLFTPNPILASGSTHTAGLVYADTTNYWTFTVITNVTIATGVAKPLNRAAEANRGFRVKVAQAGAGRANTVAAAESQLAGTPANVATAGPGEGGSYSASIVNFNNTKNQGLTTEGGNFSVARSGQADAAFPGLNMTLAGNLRWENFTAEIFGYLDLKAGYQKFGVNGDDGWAVKIGEPGNATGQVLFTVDRGAGNRDIPFAFIAPEDGLYPVRLVFYNGGGGGNAEFYTYGPNNSKNLINDAANPNSIKAYSILADITPKISFSLAGDVLTINWTNGGELQTTTSLTPPIVWTGSGDSDGTFLENLPTGEPARYYRILKP